MYNNIDKDIYIVQTGEIDRLILYSPLRGIALWINQYVLQEISRYYDLGIPSTHEEIAQLIDTIESTPIEIIKDENEVTIHDKAVILLSHRCNMECSYCYAAMSRSSEILSKDKIVTLVNYIFASQGHVKVFSFIGGGEPTLEWELLKFAVSYIRDVNKTRRKDVRISLTTNGTLLNRERIEWLVINDITVGVSFDILPSVQNFQRPLANGKSSHQFVDSNIQLLRKNGARYKLRSTITQRNVNRMKEMVEYAKIHYPDIKKLHFEPVSDTSENSSMYYNQFTSEFMNAFKYGRECGISVENSITNAFFHIRNHYCQGELCATPSGEIVSCHRHSTRYDAHFEDFKYGRIEDMVKIDPVKIDRIVKYRQKRYPQCKKCFVKYNCAGGCISIKSTLTEEQQLLYCEFIKSLCKELLKYKLTFNI